MHTLNKKNYELNRLWNNHAVAHTYPPLSENIQVDVCIIGAGITGLTTAYNLIKEGKTVAILDSKRVGSGETGSTSAHLTYALDDRYSELEKIYGNKNATLVAKSHKEAINFIENIIANEKIDCDFFRVNGVLFSGSNEQGKKILEDELHSVKRCGIDDVEFLENNPKNIYGVGECLLFPQQAQFHPLKYLTALANIVENKGGRIYEMTHVIEIKKGAPLKIKTEKGYLISAEKVVTATNAPFQTGLAIHTKLEPNRSYIIGALVPKGSVQKALYWDTDEPYHYVRIQPHNVTHDCLIVGGADHRVGMMPEVNPFQQLEQWAYQYFPQIQSIVYKWSGQILEPVDYLAFIGAHPVLNNTYMFTGDSGNGLTYGTIAGKILTDLILGIENEYALIYAPKRIHLKSWKNFMIHNISAFSGYLKYVSIKYLFKSIKNVKFNQGSIIQNGFKKIAVFKQSNGNTKNCTAVCSHLGAVLTWNEIEKTWDCPAHGSRFDTNGKVINGPAKESLKCSVNRKEKVS